MQKEDVAASFQRAAFDDVYEKAHLAAKEFDCRAVYIGGGVSLNESLRKRFAASPYPVFFPKKELCLDNGAMIAGLGYHLYLEQGAHALDLLAFPRI